jgi:hypothetical protein
MGKSSKKFIDLRQMAFVEKIDPDQHGKVIRQ